MGIQRRLSRPESVARSTGRTRPTERCGSFHLRCEQDRRKGSRERHRILQASLVIKFVLAGSWPSLRQLRHLAGLNVRALQPRYLYGFFVCSSFLKYNVIRFWFWGNGKVSLLTLARLRSHLARRRGRGARPKHTLSPGGSNKQRREGDTAITLASSAWRRKAERKEQR